MLDFIEYTQVDSIEGNAEFEIIVIFVLKINVQANNVLKGDNGNNITRYNGNNLTTG